MNERVKKLSEEIRKLSPEEQADLMDELLVLTYREPDPEIEGIDRGSRTPDRRL